MMKPLILLETILKVFSVLSVIILIWLIIEIRRINTRGKHKSGKF